MDVAVICVAGLANMDDDEPGMHLYVMIGSSRRGDGFGL